MISFLRILDPIIDDDDVLIPNSVASFRNNDITLRIDETNNFNIECIIQFYKNEADMNNINQSAIMIHTVQASNIPPEIFAGSHPMDLLYMSFVQNEYYQNEIIYK